MESTEAFYTSGDYAELHPTWDVEDSAYKADLVTKMLDRHGLEPKSVVEVGCGAGEILKQLHDRLPDDVTYNGWEIAPEAVELAKARATDRLSFKLGNFIEDDDGEYDLLLVMDVLEHVDDYLGFLRGLRNRAAHHIMYIPLDFNVEWAARSWPLVQERRTVGHVNYFNKALVEASLEDTGFTVRDTFYAPWMLDLAHYGQAETTAKSAIRRGLTRALWRLNHDLCARWLRGTSLVVLADS